MLNLGIGIPTPDVVNANFSIGNLQGIISHTREHLKDVGEIILCYQSGVRTDRNRNIILDKFIESGKNGKRIDYVLWLDADMIYPHDIICKYLEGDFDIMGCLYFKRAEPYAPVAYFKGKNPLKAFNAVNPLSIEEDKVYEVDALGYGGMMVNMDVYEALGDEKWTKYGSNFHLPYDSIDHLTHDMVFCRTAQQYGFKVTLHGGVRPGHIAEKVVTVDDWKQFNPDKINDHFEDSVLNKSGSTTLVIVPSKNKTPNQKLLNLLISRSGLGETRVNAIHQWDKKREGYHTTANRAYLENPGYDYYVFVADDVFPGRKWLLQAQKAMRAKNSGLCIPNDGKWNGYVATFSILSNQYIENFGHVTKIGKEYVTVPFNPAYKANFGDMELTVIAKGMGKAVYEPSCVLTEVDFDKDTKKGHPDDKLLFERRLRAGFDSRVRDTGLLGSYQQIKGELEPVQSVGVPEFTSDWLSKNLPSWVKHIIPHLKSIKKPRVLEIGTYEGRSAYFILDAVKDAFVVCVDPFTGTSHLDMSGVEDRFRSNLSSFSSRYMLQKEASDRFFEIMDREKESWKPFDLIYVDGLHTVDQCRRDMENAWKCLNPGGILCVDDYLWGRHDVPTRPKEAIDEFLVIHKDDAEVLFKDYQVIIRKK